jgi:hypothetical protein
LCGQDFPDTQIRIFNTPSRRRKFEPLSKTVIWGGVQELAKLTHNLPIVLLFLSDAFLDSPHVLRKEICLKEFADSILILIFLKRVFKDNVCFLKKDCWLFLTVE